jgi:parallel beta-helix repeat protein
MKLKVKILDFGRITFFILFASLIFSSSVIYNLKASMDEQGLNLVNLKYIDHAPILILNDNNFTDYGFPGIGTFSNPYIIEDLRIITTASDGIHINGTTKHFIVRNCYIETDAEGIVVKYASSGTAIIENNHMVGNDGDAIVVVSTDYPIVANNTGIGDHAGVRMHLTNHPLIYNNSFYGGNPSGYIATAGTYFSNVNYAIMYDNTFEEFNRGIFTLDCNDCIFINNTCLGTKEYGAIYLFNTDYSHIINNTITSSYSYDGIRLNQSDYNEIAYNTISLCDDFGISMESSSNYNRIYHNNVFDNNIGGSSQGYDSSSSNGNIWYNKTLNQGNYWDDYSGSGSYTIYGGSGIYDLYPLLYPIQYGEHYAAPQDDAYEENDDFLEASPISINTTHALKAFDDDYFIIDLTDSNHIELIMTFIDSEVDLDIYLCDYAGEILDGSEGYSSPEIVNYDCTYSGIYYIVVLYYSGLIGSNYELTIEVTQSAFVDDEYENNDYLDEAATLPDEGIFELYYKDIDLFNITLSRDYIYTFTMTFNHMVIDLDMYLLPPDFNGEEEDIEAYSNEYTSPEEFVYRPGYTDVYILFIIAYVENEYDLITPSEYTLEISKTLYTTEDPGNGDDTPKFTSASFVLIPFVVLTLALLYRKRK